MKTIMAVAAFALATGNVEAGPRDDAFLAGYRLGTIYCFSDGGWQSPQEVEFTAETKAYRDRDQYPAGYGNAFIKGWIKGYNDTRR
jgi:hypothetical protein